MCPVHFIVVHPARFDGHLNFIPPESKPLVNIDFSSCPVRIYSQLPLYVGIHPTRMRANGPMRSRERSIGQNFDRSWGPTRSVNRTVELLLLLECD